ncbi:MAG: hypothetical protein JRD68_08070 [Deltaproteobacteria bacterium]|nr:hypothetical protein [Deltaproteobacteria bacterium]
MGLETRLIKIKRTSGNFGSRSLILIPLLALAIMCASAGILAADEKLPSGEAVFDKYMKATGGLEAHRKVHNLFMKGTFKMVQAGITASVTTYAAEPNLIYSKVESPVLGVIESGFNGEVAWEKSLMTGPRIKEGGESLDVQRDSIFQWEARWREIYSKAETMGVEPVNGKPCYQVKMTPKKTGSPVVLYFDRESYLIVKLERAFATQRGSVSAEVFISDYRKIAGILGPFFTKTKFMGQEMIMTFESIEANVKLPKDIFDLPKEIKALQK